MKLVLWDSAEECRIKNKRVLHWTGSISSKHSENILSINSYIENHSLEIRKDFSSWIHEISSTKINNKNH